MPTRTSQLSRRQLSGRRRKLFTLLALLFGFLVGLLVCELALRVHVARRGWTANCYVTGLAFFVPDSQAGYTLRPGLRLKSSTYDVTVNSLGLRGPEIDAEKASDLTRVAVLGGSSVFGYLVPDGKDSCRALERLLENRFEPVEVLNAGVPGFNMRQCRHRFESQIARLEPDLVILYLGWNDMPFLLEPESEARQRTPPAPPWMERCLANSVLYGFLRYRIFPPPTPRFAPPPESSLQITSEGATAFKADLQALIDAIRSSGATPIISTQLMASGSTAEGLEEYLGDSPDQIAASRTIGAWITTTMKQAAETNAVPLVDCAAQVPCNPGTLGDAIHLTEQGHQLVAEAWASGLAPLLNELKKTPQD